VIQQPHALPRHCRKIKANSRAHSRKQVRCRPTRTGKISLLLIRMGNSSSSSGRHHDDTVDYGHLTPQGVYSSQMDWNQQIVSQLIVERKLAPFYRPLEEYDASWDDDRILAARKEHPDSDHSHGDSASGTDGTSSKTANNKRSGAVKDQGRHLEAHVYRGAVECPICFLVRS
jgi:hypothetical protein